MSSAPAPGGGVVLLYEAAIEAALQGGLRTAGDGRPLEPLPLPYSLGIEATAAPADSAPSSK